MLIPFSDTKANTNIMWYGYEDIKCPVAEDVYEHIISLPIFPGLTEENQDYVIEQVKRAVSM